MIAEIFEQVKRPSFTSSQSQHLMLEEFKQINVKLLIKLIEDYREICDSAFCSLSTKESGFCTPHPDHCYHNCTWGLDLYITQNKCEGKFYYIQDTVSWTDRHELLEDSCYVINLLEGLKTYGSEYRIADLVKELVFNKLA